MCFPPEERSTTSFRNAMFWCLKSLQNMDKVQEQNTASQFLKINISPLENATKLHWLCYECYVPQQTKDTSFSKWCTFSAFLHCRSSGLIRRERFWLALFFYLSFWQLPSSLWYNLINNRCWTNAIKCCKIGQQTVIITIQ
jgi:hypothetical protein